MQTLDLAHRYMRTHLGMHTHATHTNIDTWQTLKHMHMTRCAKAQTHKHKSTQFVMTGNM